MHSAFYVSNLNCTFTLKLLCLWSPVLGRTLNCFVIQFEGRHHFVFNTFTGSTCLTARPMSSAELTRQKSTLMSSANSLIFHPFCVPSLFLPLLRWRTITTEHKWAWPSSDAHAADPPSSNTQTADVRFRSPLHASFAFCVEQGRCASSLSPLSPSLVTAMWSHFSSIHSPLCSFLVSSMPQSPSGPPTSLCMYFPLTFHLLPPFTFVISHPLWLSSPRRLAFVLLSGSLSVSSSSSSSTAKGVSGNDSSWCERSLTSDSELTTTV